MVRKVIKKTHRKKPEEITESAIARIISMIKGKTKVDLSDYKVNTIKRRIERQMALHKKKDIDDFATFLRTSPESVVTLFEDVFIHVTGFFRDPSAFAALEESVFPSLVKNKKPGDSIRIWIPGCSTGEEAYSLAIALTEYLEKKKLHLEPTIFATDISELTIQKARQALYSDDMLSKISQKRLKAFFEKASAGYKVCKKIRDICVFSQHDLIVNPPFSKLDLISCRNVLIYFGPALQQKVFPLFYYALRDSGFLWLGTSESPGSSGKLFNVVDKKHKIYSKNLSVSTKLPQLAQYHFGKPQLQLPTILGKQQVLPDLQRNADHMILQRYAPSGVIVNSQLEIIHFRGKTSPYLSPPAGKPSNGLLKMAHPDLAPTLRLLVQAAKRKGISVRKEKVKLKTEKQVKLLNIEVSPLNPLAPEADQLHLIVFEDLTAPKFIKKSTSKKTTTKNIKTQEAEELVKELEDQREYLQSVFDQFESIQEELMSSNEELQASNEELHSTNEELESAKEELQSANQELVSTNFELETRNDELNRLNEQLARSEERFRLIVEVVKDYAIYMLDINGNITSWNEGAKRFKGYEAREVMGKHFSKFYTPEDIIKRKPEWEIERARIDGRVEDEGWRVRKDGTKFWASVVLTRIDDQHGNLLGYSKVTRDLTERKIALEELRKSEERFRQMVSVVRDYAIILLDTDGIIVSWNEGAKRIKGYEASEIIGSHFSRFYLPDDIARQHPEYELRVAIKEGKFEEESWRKKKDGTRFWANVVITRVDDSEGNHVGFVKVTRDLSERKKNEEELKKAYRGLEERVKERTKELEIALNTRDEFLSIASHELKTPLTSLKLQLQTSRRKYAKEPDVAASTQDITKVLDMGIKQVNSLANLVEDLLDVSRIQTGIFQLNYGELDLSELAEDVIQRFTQQLVTAGCTLELKLENGLKGHWDRYRLEQVIVNLLFNAIKYAPGRPIHVTTSLEGQTAVLSVKDFGPGIDKTKQAIIFERFERVSDDKNIGGLGLGLFIIRRIVEAHHGKIEVESDIGKGAKFSVTLPLSQN